MSLMFGKARTCNIVTVPEHEPSECNIVILGANGSGKSALTVKFLTKRFISEYDPNLDTYSSEEVVDQQPVLVKVMDTADQDGPVNCERYLGWANAFIIVYSIDNRTSFEACQQYLEAVTLYSKGLQPEGPVILLGNKVDMERYRQVSKADGAALALRFGCLFFEVSACLDFLSVQQIFHEAVREVRRETERSIRPLFISEDKSAISLSSAPPLTTCYKELPTPATAKLVTVKSSRAQSKRRAPTLTLLKGFKIF
ncbi:ras-like protein family member 12 isoform X4 [Carassius auratus]|uniref:small monomeric GTPase n=1 Tax=Carassius auratus TaxID=7957 RepID=A0A6P6PNK9_CARAU|nr:ras-like protein family member 12 isoform X4 [Carassius auratus]XP_052418027.1 ras-like protein family member 12 isoform X4 [Carassius gibelio]